MKHIKTKIQILLFFTIVLFIITSCKKEKPDKPLPPNTEIGANTFIFRVNGGEIIESEVVAFFPTSPRIHVFYNHLDTFQYHDYRFGISGNKEIMDEDKSIYIQVEKMPNAGKYILSEYAPLGKSSYAYYKNYESETLSFFTNINNTGKVIITKLDTVNKIISGNFKFKAQRHLYNEELEEYVTIDGQFDVRYKPNEGVNYY